MAADVAIIGGGLTGCAAALDYAERGHRVCLFESAPALLTRASAANEGKIHLGYTYAADASFRTAQRLLEDALQFRRLLTRWMREADFDACLYDPFLYAVPEESALSAARITRHFASVEDALRKRLADGQDYLGERQFVPFRAITDASFMTMERGVWPAGIAAAITRSVEAHHGIEVRLGARVEKVAPAGESWRIILDGQEAAEGPFGLVVNAAWAERRRIDGRSGFAAGSRWFTRFKYGVLLERASEHLPGVMPPNTTATSGRFGDCVHFPQNDMLYCSWYPAGMCLSTMAEDFAPPALNAEDQEKMMRRTWQGCASFAPALARLAELPSPLPARLIGDFIMAKGETDIDDPASGLHQRSTHGAMELARGYWSVETGKYTSAPRCAADCVRLSLGEDG